MSMPATERIGGKSSSGLDLLSSQLTSAIARIEALDQQAGRIVMKLYGSRPEPATPMPDNAKVTEVSHLVGCLSDAILRLESQVSRIEQGYT